MESSVEGNSRYDWVKCWGGGGGVIFIMYEMYCNNRKRIEFSCSSKKTTKQKRILILNYYFLLPLVNIWSQNSRKQKKKKAIREKQALEIKLEWKPYKCHKIRQTR